MTEPREPDAPEPTEPHHGLVEEIREEIAEVVEHVPEPVRWTVGKLIWLSLLAVVGFIVLIVVSIGLYLANRTEWVAQELTLFLNQTLASRSDVVIEIKDIRGNPLVGIRVIEPRVKFRDGKGPTLLEARSMQVGYSALSLMQPNRRWVDVTMDDATIRLGRGADGKLRLPKWKSGAPGGAQSSMRLHLIVQNATLITPEPELHAEGGHLDVIANTSPSRIDLVDLSWKHGPYGTTLEKLAGTYAVSDSVRFEVRELRSEELQLRATGAWPKGATERRAHVDIARVRWRLLARLFDNKSFDVPGEGRAVVDVQGSRDWHGRFAANIDWDNLKGDGEGAFRFEQHRLAVVPLTFRSPAGILDGRMDWAHEGWAIGGAVQKGNPLHWEALHITGWPAGNLNGRFRYNVDTRPNGSGNLTAHLLESELAGWRADSADFVMDMPSGAIPDSFTVRMLRRGGEAVLHGRTRIGGWGGSYTVARYALDEWPDGRASGIRGTVTQGAGGVDSRDGKLYVTGALAGIQTDWLGMHAARWKLERISGPLLQVPDMLADAHLEDLTYLAVHFDSASAALHLGDRSLELQSVRAMAGDTVLTLAGRSLWSKDGWTLSLDRADAQSSQFHWVAVPPVELHGVPSGVTFDRLEARDGDAHLAISGRWAGAHGEYDWHGRGERLDLARLGLPLEWQLSGRADATLEVSGKNGDPRWTFTGLARSPGKSGHAADSIRLELAGAPSRLEVKEAKLLLRGGTLEARGRVERTARAWPDTLTANGVLRWLSDAQSWQGTVEAKDLPIDRLGTLVPAAEGWAGTLSGGVNVGGSPQAPTFDVHAHMVAPAWKDYRADDLDIRARYAGGRLDVSEARMTRSAVVSKASGYMPLQLALGRNPVLPEAPMQWDVEIPNGDLALMPLFVPQIGSAAGRFLLKARIAGTARHPNLDGQIQIRDGTVRLAAREEVLEAVHADLRVDQNRVTLDSLTARQGPRGRVRARGGVDLNGLALKGYKFDLEMLNFSAAEHGLYAAEFDGNFTVTNGPRVHNVTLPMVQGRADVKKAVILFDFSNQSEMQQIAAATQPLFWTYQIHLAANSNLRWRPPEGDIEFSADLNLEQTRDSLIIYGEMQAIRGTYYFLSNRFTVTRANLTFDNVGGTNPLLDIEATTRIVGSSQEPSDKSAHNIRVTITGRANAPVIALADESGTNPWDQALILRELTYGTFVGGQFYGQQPLDNYITRAINRSLSADLSQAFGNYVNEWSLQRDRGGLLGEGDLIISAGSQINSRLSLKYSQVLHGFTREITTPQTDVLFERDVEAEYRINRFIFISTEIAQRRVVTGITAPSNGTPDFNVNLKARWEY